MTFSVALVILIVAGLGYHFYHQAGVAKNPQAAAQAEEKQLVAAIGKLMVLPDEEPIIATVADPSKLQDQPFFSKAKKGDKVLIYNNARKAILYDPVAGRIIDVAPLSAGTSPAPKPNK